MSRCAHLINAIVASAAAVLCTTAHAGVPTQFPEQTLMPPGAESPLAAPLDIDGRTALLIGDRVDEYRRKGAGDWVWRSSLPQPPIESLRAYGEVALSGDVALVSDQVFKPSNHSFTLGIVHAYKRERGIWHYVETVRCPDSAPFGDTFGRQLKLDGHHAAIGAFLLSTAYAYRVERSGRLTLESRLVPESGPEQGFARELELAGHTIMVATTESPGVVRVYEESHGVWAEKQIIQAPNSGLFGAAIALDEHRAFIAAPSENFHPEPDQGGFPSSGVVREFVRVHGEWLMGRELASPDSFNGSFGARLAFDGRRLLVLESGSATEQNSFGSRGFLYERSDKRWQLHRRLVTTPDPTIVVTIGLDDGWAMMSDVSRIPGVLLGATYAYELQRSHHGR
ncbi:MAG TPA: hypothetical protein VGD41_03365 [Pyrinomonadaceae bacterium]